MKSAFLEPRPPACPRPLARLEVRVLEHRTEFQISRRHDYLRGGRRGLGGHAAGHQPVQQEARAGGHHERENAEPTRIVDS